MNKNVLILGGSGGIGLAITKLLSKNKYNIIATYFSDEKKAKKMKNDFNNCEFVKCDLRSDDDIERLISKFSNNKIDVVINSVCSNLKLKLFEKIEMSEFEDDININLLGVVRFYKKIIPVLKSQKSGIVINMITEAVFNPVPLRMSSYVISKYGLLGLTKSIARELEAFGVKVYGVSPSFVETELIQAFPSKLLELEREKLSNKRFLEPAEVAQFIFKIILNSEKYKTGDNILLKK